MRIVLNVRPSGRLMVFYDPALILVEFIRSRVSDPNSSRTYTQQTETFDGDGSTTSFSLSPTSGKMQWVESVTVGGTTMKKWQEYYVDIELQKIVFVTAPGSGSANIVVVYRRGATCWVYNDTPHFKDLTEFSYPRISVAHLNPGARTVGSDTSGLIFDWQFQVNCWTKEGEKNMYVVDGQLRGHLDLCRYLLLQVLIAYKTYNDDLYPALYNVREINGPRDLPFEETDQAYHSAVDLRFTGNEKFVGG